MQFAEDLNLALKWEVSNLPTVLGGEAIPLGADTLSLGKAENENYILEEYSFKKRTKATCQIDGKDLSSWFADNLFPSGSYWNTKAQNDILVLSDDDFKDFVNLSTEVITRIKIDNETGTVQAGALFTEEYLPAESVLYSLVLASPEFVTKGSTRPEKAEPIMDIFKSGIMQLPVIQLGGNATLGKGLLRTKLIEPKNEESNG